MADESISAKVLRNTAWNYIGLLFNIAVRLAVLPYVVHSLGNDAFGIYSIVAVVIGYASLLEFGIGTSLSKFVAELGARKEFDRLNTMISTAIVMYLVLGATGCAVLILLTGTFVHTVFNIPVDLVEAAKIVFIISSCAFTVSFVIGIFGNIIHGLQRHDIFNKILIFMSALRNIGGVVVLWLGYGLVEFVAYQALSGVAGISVMVFFSKRLLPQVSIIPRQFDWGAVRTITNFSFAVFINQISAKFMGTLDKVIVGIFLPISQVTIYSIGVTVVLLLWRIPAMVTSALTPASSELDALDRSEAIQTLVRRGMKYTSVLGAAIFLVSGVLAEPLIRIWMGEGYEQSARVLQILLVGFSMLVVIAPNSQVMVGIGRPYINTIYALAQIALNLTLGPLLVWKYGIYGAAYGASSAFTIGGAVFIVHSCRIFGIPLRSLFGAKFFLSAGVIAMLAAGLGWVNHRHPAQGVIDLAVYSLGFCMLYFLYTVRYVMDEFDIEKLSRVIPWIRHLRVLQK